MISTTRRKEGEERQKRKKTHKNNEENKNNLKYFCYSQCSKKGVKRRPRFQSTLTSSNRL